MKVYVDCGAYKGRTVKAFKETVKNSEEFAIYAFEPNPFAKVHKKDREYTVFKKAVWIEDGEKKFYTNWKHRACQGATLLKEKTSGGLDKSKPMMVETVDFGKWIMETFKKDDTIIVKMDIEGAEFTVLPQMIADGSIEYINTLYIETHGDRIGLPPDAHEKLLETLDEIKTLDVREEFAHLTYKKDK